MISLSEAQQRIQGALGLLGTERVALTEAGGRILREGVTAATDLPVFDNSAMDGYAVRAEDLKGAASGDAAVLRLVGEQPAGVSLGLKVSRGECARVYTGAPIPAGADAVVMQEDVEHRQGEGCVLCREPVRPWENVRPAGGDVRSGELLKKAGARLTAADLGLLAAVGVGSLSVACPPRVGILATGDELREPGQPLRAGEIYESNRVSLTALVAEAGGIPRAYPLIGDQLARTQRALTRAATDNDVVLTSGGVSVGRYDYVRSAIEGLGGEVIFWKVAVKPGKPFLFGRLNEKFLFGLPGNPVSALVTFLLLVRPAILAMQGAEVCEAPSYPGVLAEKISNPGARPHWMRVRATETGSVYPAEGQGSHHLRSLAWANGLVEVPPETVWEAGQWVSVLRWPA